MLTVTDIAEDLKLSRQTVQAYLKTGLIQGVKIGRRWRVADDAYAAFKKSLTASPDPHGFSPPDARSQAARRGAVTRGKK